MEPGYFKDMEIVDERLLNLERKVERILQVLVKLETTILNKTD